MNDAQRRAAQWLRASRATETQETLAADIERVTGWHITRDRYSKYESGSIPMGRAVLARFVGYWESRGKPGPESIDGAAEPVTESSALVRALADQTEAINRLIDRLDSLASSAIRDGVADALREAGLIRAAGASPDGPPHGLQP